MFSCFFLCVTVCVAKPEIIESEILGPRNPDCSSVSENKADVVLGGRSVGRACRTLEISDAENDYFSCKEKVLRSGP